VAAKRLTVVVLLAGYLAVSSGLAMAVHVHEAGPSHDSHSCPIHHQLTQTTKAGLVEPAPISFDVQSVYLSHLLQLMCRYSNARAIGSPLVLPHSLRPYLS